MRLISAIVLILALAARSAAGAPALSHIREEIENLSSVDGAAVGYAGIPGRFYLLYPYCVTYGDEKTLLDFSQDKNAIVAVMGALCLIDKFPQRREEVMGRMKQDDRSVLVFPGGCVGTTMTVKALFEKIQGNPDFIVPMRFHRNRPEDRQR